MALRGWREKDIIKDKTRGGRRWCLSKSGSTLSFIRYLAGPTESDREQAASPRRVCIGGAGGGGADTTWNRRRAVQFLGGEEGATAGIPELRVRGRNH